MDRYKTCLTLVMATTIIQDMDTMYIVCMSNCTGDFRLTQASQGSANWTPLCTRCLANAYFQVIAGTANVCLSNFALTNPVLYGFHSHLYRCGSRENLILE